MVMYIHAGNNKIIRTKTIIGIFDMDTATMAQTTRDYLRTADREKRVVNIKEDLPKSFLVTDDGKVYISQLSTTALTGRVDS